MEAICCFVLKRLRSQNSKFRVRFGQPTLVSVEFGEGFCLWAVRADLGPQMSSSSASSSFPNDLTGRFDMGLCV